ncbi:sulfurtransferase [Parachitinimonas caeni]|uniref:Sulfurtransferase n=1 Tax=Parachitinimonas caeni TaxID=3031301 RepID=A0ABT7DX60_9NEIS|nr:sulfurtransferase [Parachitinimonas caeni]MDK2123668.1 sulfurtransferase [Parachitinimonas caeni]
MSKHALLVSVSDLAKHRSHGNWIIVDCRHDLMQPGAGRAAYQFSHIPGAVFVDVDLDLSAPKTGKNGRHPLPDPEEFAARMAMLGLDQDAQIVAYDASGGIYAARFWWMLRWIGHANVAVLDGGFGAWTSAGLPVESGENRRAAGRLSCELRRQSTVSAEDLLAKDASWQVVDARTAERYAGIGETLDPVAGHIPGARNRFYMRNLTQHGFFRPAPELVADWQDVIGDTPTAQLVMQCGSGITACHNLLSLELAGISGVRLYPGSWSEWCSDASRPIATGPQPGTM